MNERIKLHVILVGSNPLPCYIQAAYALEEGEGLGKRPDKIMFVVTKDGGSMANGTKKFAENIKKVLEDSYDCSKVIFDYLELDNGYDSKEIEDEIVKKISQINKETQIDEIFLNNTGGTKAMAVYATMAIRGLPFYNSIFVTECYVDPQKNQLRCYKIRARDGKDNEMECLPKEGDLRDFIKLTINELIFLHYGANTLECSDLNEDTYSYKKEDNKEDKPQKEMVLSEKQYEIARKLLNDDEAWNTYSQLYTRCPKSCTRMNKNKTAKERAIRDLTKVIKKWESQFIVKLHGLFEISEDIDLCHNEEAKRWMLLFLSGEWLERYFYKAVLNAKENLANKGIEIHTVWSCNVKPVNENGSENSKSFEVDVVVLKGYEMALFSISMAEKGEEGLAKGKWFEAVYRTEQMAGEHGEVAIVNLMDAAEMQNSYIEKFKKDLENFNRDVELFNRKDLKDYDALVERLTEKFS